VRDDAALEAGFDETLGANITVPFKERVAPMVDRLTEEAHATGAVDTITREGTRLIGHNTDVLGFRPTLDALVGRAKMPKAAVVLGAGGDRDTGKRAVMGELAARLADLVVITDDNPRSEDPAAIRAALLDGTGAAPPAERAHVLEVADRAQAIEAALAAARAGDCVLVAGKGHEQGQHMDGRSEPFDDRVVARAALSRRST